jgi:hypothetical protein
MVWCGTRDAGAGATERLTRGREKKVERKSSVSFILFRCRDRDRDILHINIS